MRIAAVCDLGFYGLWKEANFVLLHVTFTSSHLLSKFLLKYQSMQI